MDKSGVKKVIDAAVTEIADVAKRGEDVALWPVSASSR
jgi:hypothetical protein